MAGCDMALTVDASKRLVSLMKLNMKNTNPVCMSLPNEKLLQRIPLDIGLFYADSHECNPQGSVETLV